MSSTILSMISSTLLGLEPLLGSSKLVGLRGAQTGSGAKNSRHQVVFVYEIKLHQKNFS